MKSAGIKIEGSKKPYQRFESSYDVKARLESMVEKIESNQAIEVKVGNNHYYIEKEDDWFIKDVMYYVEKYLG